MPRLRGIIDIRGSMPTTNGSNRFNRTQVDGSELATVNGYIICKPDSKNGRKPKPSRRYQIVRYNRQLVVRALIGGFKLSVETEEIESRVPRQSRSQSDSTGVIVGSRPQARQSVPLNWEKIGRSCLETLLAVVQCTVANLRHQVGNSVNSVAKQPKLVCRVGGQNFVALCCTHWSRKNF